MNSIELKVFDLSIACKTWGNPTNPAVIALHGWLDNANSFAPIAEYLQKKYYLVAVDLPGHGYSSHLPLSANYHFTDGIFNVMKIMDTLQFDKVHLLGHSMGACLASLIAGVAPERLLSMNLIEGLGPFSNPEDSACEQLTKFLKYVTHHDIKKPRGYDSFAQAAQARSIKGYVSLDIAETLCERGLIELNGKYQWRHDRRLLVPSPLRMTERQILSCLQQIKTKSCLIWASNGFAFNSDVMQKRVKAVNHLTIKHLEGGHHIHMEKPEIVGQFLAKFMAK